MEFEWDDAKEKANIAKHGVSFALASRIFEGATLTRVDDRFDYGEEREVSIGMAAGAAILVVVHTDRQGRTRIISARAATRMERKRYEQTLRQSPYA